MSFRETQKILRAEVCLLNATARSSQQAAAPTTPKTVASNTGLLKDVVGGLQCTV